MKLFATLILTVAVQTLAEDDLPNLRGVVGIALTNGNGEERGGGGPIGIGTCRKMGEHCSTSNTTSANFQCCSIGQRGTTEALTCNPDANPDASVSNPSYNGICVAVSDPGEVDE
eukprot:scaffold15403_cov133-Skeletonema_menzelii.AAC.5